MFPAGLETQFFLGGEVTVAERVAPFAYGGIHIHADGEVDIRDANVGVSWTPYWSPEFVLRVRPGLSVPTGGLTNSFLFTPLSTSSLDPWLAVDALAGKEWLFGSALVARTPLYEGWDQVRQGPFLRGDVRMSRRFSFGVPWLGLSGVRQAPSTPVGASPSFAELAMLAGSVFHPHERWSVTVQLRVPVAVTEGAVNAVSGGVAVRRVVGAREVEDHH